MSFYSFLSTVFDLTNDKQTHSYFLPLNGRNDWEGLVGEMGLCATLRGPVAKDWLAAFNRSTFNLDSSSASLFAFTSAIADSLRATMVASSPVPPTRDKSSGGGDDKDFGTGGKVEMVVGIGAGRGVTL